jgi:hypothetical protein
MAEGQNRYKVAVLTICLNQPYHPYLGRMVESAKKFFLQGHEVDYFSWSDMPENAIEGVKIFSTVPVEWPLPTLQRYSLFLQQEELLKEYDFLFYIDADMEFVSRVGDEVLGKDLTAAAHPMYYVSRQLIPPYEPNKDSTSYIPRPGRVIEVDGKKRFEPLYAAGGFQGGRSDSFIKAMKVMKGWIDEDFSNNYIPVWNDETAWNKYLFENPSSVFLSPSYVYPDSLNRAYYQRIWGRNYVPKLVTLTKPFSLTKDGGVALNNILR